LRKWYAREAMLQLRTSKYLKIFRSLCSWSRTIVPHPPEFPRDSSRLYPPGNCFSLWQDIRKASYQLVIYADLPSIKISLFHLKIPAYNARVFLLPRSPAVPTYHQSCYRDPYP
jgi:hypothetical protein